MRIGSTMDGIRAATAQIKAGASRGTGFLVTVDGWVLTALHVIADLQASRSQNQLVPHANQFDLRFGDPRANGQLIPAVGKIAGAQFDLKQDWVLFRCEPPPAGVAPLPLAKLIDDGNPIRWSSWGFAGTDPENGTWYQGETTSIGQNDILELYSPEAAGGRGGLISGLSGAPLVAGGQVIGLVQTALLEKDEAERKRSVEGKLFARRLDPIVAATNGRLSWTDDGLPIPFEADIDTLLDKIGPAKRQEIATTLLKQGFAADERIKRNIARALTIVPFARASEALSALPQLWPQEAVSLLRIAAALSLHPRAIEVVKRGSTRQDSALAAWLSCSSQPTPSIFIHRAHYDDFRGLWQEKLVTVDLTGQEVTAKVVIDYVGAHWCTKRKKTAERQKDRPQWLRNLEFCLVLRNVLAVDELAEVCEAFQKARVLMVSEASVPEDERQRLLPKVQFVLPEVDSNFEDSVTTAFEDFRVEDIR
jgi:hypothetical protein